MIKVVIWLWQEFVYYFKSSFFLHRGSSFIWDCDTALKQRCRSGERCLPHFCPECGGLSPLLLKLVALQSESVWVRDPALGDPAPSPLVFARPSSLPHPVWSWLLWERPQQKEKLLAVDSLVITSLCCGATRVGVKRGGLPSFGFHMFFLPLVRYCLWPVIWGHHICHQGVQKNFPAGS